MKKLVCRSLAVLLLVAPLAARADDEALKTRVTELEKRLAELEKGMTPGASTPTGPSTPAAPKASDPFAFADFTWLTGNSREKDSPFDSKYFTGEFIADVNYTYSLNHPKDHTIDGACEVGRSNEFQIQQLGFGGDIHVDNVRGRIMTQFGMYSQMTPRNDISPSRGQWNLGNGYQYISEAYGGYHWDVMHGINLDAGIFMSYIGLDSYYNSENWSYTPSYVSANTPWFFNGMRMQIFPTETLKIEPWLINGWQSYGMFNEMPGLGMEILWRPTGNWSLVSNDYWGYDTIGQPSRQRWHTDDSVQYKYYDSPSRMIDKAAVSLTVDAGCESGAGVSCFGTSATPAQNFQGFMLYHRAWFHHDLFGLTIGGGAINNPGRYLVLLPPINGATATSGTPYFTENPGDPFRAWDTSVTFDYMPSQYLTWRAEFNHRDASVPYFAGPQGMTPAGGNQGAPGSAVAGFTPDLRRTENRFTLAMLVRM
jgi:hypothetical protein